MLEYILSLSIISLIYILLAQSYNLSFGRTGLFNLGHIIFYGIGAYSTAILNTRYGFGFFENLFISGFFASIAALGISLLTLRLSGHYLAIATLGLGLIAQVIATNWVALTRGPLGIREIENPEISGFNFDSNLSLFWLYLCVVIGCLFVLYKIFYSPFGRILQAIKSDEIATIAVGKNTFSAKTWSFVLSAFFAGIAGCLYSHYRLFLDPSIFALHEIIFIIVVVVIGGRGHFWGCVLSLICLTILGEIPRFIGFPDTMIGAMRNLLFAALLILTLFYRPEGLFSKKKS